MKTLTRADVPSVLVAVQITDKLTLNACKWGNQKDSARCRILFTLVVIASS